MQSQFEFTEKRPWVIFPFTNVGKTLLNRIDEGFLKYLAVGYQFQ